MSARIASGGWSAERCRAAAAVARMLAPAVIVAACAGGETGASPVIDRDSAGIAIVENDLTRLSTMCTVESEPAVSIGSDDGGADYELHRVFGASRLSDGRIVLVNQGSQQLRFYDQAGQFLMSAGRAGQGPGEFSDAFYLWVLPGDTVWVGDYRPWQFLVFSPDGEWVRTVRPTPLYPNSPNTINVLDDGRAVLAERPFQPYGPRFELREITVVIHGGDGVLLDTVGTFPDGRWGTVGDAPGSPGLYPLFESFARIDAAGSRLLTGHMSEASLNVFAADDTLRLERIVRWTAGSRDISQDDVDAERVRLAEPYEDLDPARRAMFVEPLISEDRPVADRFPAYASAMLGRDGRIWIREYARPRGPQTQRWVAFDADGHFQCLATLPEVDQVYEIGSDYMLALDRDDLGVERVVLHSLAGPINRD